jgi:sigma-E factor negative regulatory protein RseC
MIEEQGTVVGLKGEWAVVEPSTSGGCSSCSSSGGCGTASLARFFGQRKQQHYAQNPINARTGDQVVMGLEEKALLSSSLLMYLVPLLAMILGAIIFSSGFGDSLPGTDGAELLGAAMGLAAGLGLAKLLSFRMRKRLYPIITRILPGSR